MDFTAFLSSAQSPDFWNQRKNFCFVGSSYPMTFFGLLFDLLKKKNNLPAPYQRLFFDSLDKKSLHATLGQSMLGSFSFFWLGSLSEEKENKSTQELTNFLCSYQGPHIISYFINTDSKYIPKQAKNFINLPSDITFDQCLLLANFFGQTVDSKKKAFTKKIFTSTPAIQLDTACMLLNYLELAGSKNLDTYTAFFMSIMGTPPSLSQLSEYFFTKNSKAFFNAWSTLEKEYPEIFWIIFWSEQLWKAHYVIEYLREKNFVQAKRMSFRLPYSFINRDWQKFTTKELIQAHEFLYTMDYALKTGSTFCSLDLFYINFFTGKFA